MNSSLERGEIHMSYQRNFEKRLNVAVVGCGSHSYRNILPLMHYLPVRLVAVCDIREEQARLCAEEYGCRYYSDSAEMYKTEALDAVFLCVGAKYHCALAREALEAGLHVWMEKPIAVNAQQVVELMKHTGDRICMVGFKKAYMPAAKKAKALADDMGGMSLITATYPMSIPENGEELLARGETPNWLLNGVHPLSFLVYMGGRAKSVCAHTGMEGVGAFTIKFENGAIGCLNMTPPLKPNIERYAVYGPDWQAEIDNRAVSFRRSMADFVYDQTVDFTDGGMDSAKMVWEPGNCVATLENKALFTQGFYAETMDFCNSVLTGAAPVNGTLDMALEIMLVYEAGLISHGNTVYVHAE